MDRSQFRQPPDSLQKESCGPDREQHEKHGQYDGLDRTSEISRFFVFHSLSQSHFCPSSVSGIQELTNRAKPEPRRLIHTTSLPLRAPDLLVI